MKSENKIKSTINDLDKSDVIKHGQHMLASCNTHGHLG